MTYPLAVRGLWGRGDVLLLTGTTLIDKTGETLEAKIVAGCAATVSVRSCGLPTTSPPGERGPSRLEWRVRELPTRTGSKTPAPGYCPE